jgi:hypothetical protein
VLRNRLELLTSVLGAWMRRGATRIADLYILGWMHLKTVRLWVGQRDKGKVEDWHWSLGELESFVSIMIFFRDLISDHVS